MTIKKFWHWCRINRWFINSSIICNWGKIILFAYLNKMIRVSINERRSPLLILISGPTACIIKSPLVIATRYKSCKFLNPASVIDFPITWELLSTIHASVITSIPKSWISFKFSAVDNFSVCSFLGNGFSILSESCFFYFFGRNLK